jgi:succinyl-CoA synthetase beta subunit
MKIHEYQAKEILKEYGVPIPRGYLALTKEEAVSAYEKLQSDKVVIKAQVHAGGRGKGGGIKLAEGLKEVSEVASSILGMHLKTHQDPVGRLVSKIYIEEAAQIECEMYVSVVLDRARGSLCLIGSNEGGVEIEKIAEEDRLALIENPQQPSRIHKVHIPVQVGWAEYIGRKLAGKLGINGRDGLAFADICGKLVKVVLNEDATMVEINPLVRLTDGSFRALDAKIGLDDNLGFRHPHQSLLRDKNEEDPLELRASEAGLNYIKLDGNIGCMVNGAGLAMATMDIIKLKGAEPANFLDVGGGASAESVATAFSIIQSDPSVKAILINIFGGIVKCDLVAQGIISALSEVELKVPLVVRLQGTNATEAMLLLSECSFPIIVAEDLGSAAEKVTAAAKGGVNN